MSADKKLMQELSKAELAFDYVETSQKIEFLKKELKLAQMKIEKIEALLLPQIGVKYQPKGADFILMPKVSKGRKSTSYATVTKDAPKLCKFSASQEAIFADLVESQTKISEDKKTIQIVK